MRELILAIQAALRNAVRLVYIADMDIFVTPDDNLLPIAIGFPAVGLKDGVIDFVFEDGRNQEINYNVDIIIYQLLQPGEISMVGQVTPKVHGVLEIANDIHHVLRDNKLSIAGMEVALPASEGAVEWMEGTDVSVVKKRITYQYKKLEANP